MTSVDKSTTPEDSVDETTSAHPASDDLAALTSTAPIAGGTGDYFRLYIQRVRGGDMGSLPAVTGLVVLAVFFSIVHPSFHSIFNFGNMFTEGTGTIFIAMGLVFVLLLGEIDLAAGYTAGVCAAVMIRLMVGYQYSWYVTIPAALISGLIIGFITGWLRAKVGIPSFIVTLAFFLAFQGLDALHPQHRQGPARRHRHHRQGRDRPGEQPDAHLGRLDDGCPGRAGLRGHQARRRPVPPQARSGRRARRRVGRQDPRCSP